MKTPAAEQIKGQLERMLAGATFAPAARLRAFLRYVVERTLAGDAGSLKEYAIGVDVFKRDDEYDPRIDSIVRVEARRLRAKIEEYYAGEGAADPVVISIARGSYVPVFTMREAPASAAPVPGTPVAAAGEPPRAGRRAWLVAAAAIVAIGSVAAIAIWRPAREAPPAPPSTSLHVAVIPFAHFAPADADRMLAARITDGVTTELARINVVAVVSSTSARQSVDTRHSLQDLLSSLEATTAVEGSVYSDGNAVRVRTRIVDRRADRKGNIRDFEGRRDAVDDLARRIAEALSATFQARALR